MVEGNARIEPKEGGAFSIWDGAITGKTLEIHPEKLMIVQSWRYEYDNWPTDTPSTIRLVFIPHKEKFCKLQLEQTGVPEQYVEEITKGWEEYYWKPMKKYFQSATV